MPYLYIRGRQDPIEISDKDAKVIKNALDKKMPFSTIIPLVNSSWKLSEVKGVVFEKPTVNQKRQTDDNEYMERLRRIDFDYRKNFINNLTNKDKAREYIYHFKLFYQNYTGCLPTIDIVNQVLSSLEKFYEDNPKFVVPSIKVYKKIMGTTKHQEDTFFTGSIMELFETLENNEVIKTKTKAIISNYN